MLTQDNKQEEIKRLQRLLYERDKEFERAKLRRVILTIAGFAVAFFLILWKVADKKEPTEILGLAAAAVFLSGIYFLINASVFGYLFNKGRAESDSLKRIRDQIEELRKSIPQ